MNAALRRVAVAALLIPASSLPAHACGPPPILIPFLLGGLALIGLVEALSWLASFRGGQGRRLGTWPAVALVLTLVLEGAALDHGTIAAWALSGKALFWMVGRIDRWSRRRRLLAELPAYP